MKDKIIFGVIVVLVAGGAFYAGIKYASAGRSANRNNFTRGMQSGNIASVGQKGMSLGGMVGGEILSKDDKSITVKTPNGGSRLIFLSGTTEVSKSATGTLEDLSVGTQVSVQGTDNSDGSVTAKTVQVRPTVPAAR